MATPLSSASTPAHSLDTAALILVGDGATPDQLAERFRALEAVQRPDGAAALLTRLARLGLVRVASGEADRASYVLTPLGQQYARAPWAGSPRSRPSSRRWSGSGRTCCPPLPMSCGRR